MTAAAPSTATTSRTSWNSEGACIKGRVLEIGENTYTLKFGKNVTQSDVLHVHEGIEGTTFVDDLAAGHSLPSNAFDCVIVTQTLHLIYDMKAAIKTIYRILKPGGCPPLHRAGNHPDQRRRLERHMVLGPFDGLREKART